MRHRKTAYKLSRRTGQRLALLKGLTRNLLIYQRIKTTLAKAKAARGEVERLITLAKEDTLHHRRLAYNLLQDHKLTSQLFKEIAPLFKSRNGGYTRIIRLNHRVGDNAQMVLLELVEQRVKKAAAKPVEEKKKAEQKVKPEVKAKEMPKVEEVQPEVEKPKKAEKIEKKVEKEVKPKAEETIKPKEKEVKEVKKEEPREKQKGFLSGIKKLFKGKNR